MRRIIVYRNGKVDSAIEVTKGELLKLKSNNPFISISDADAFKLIDKNKNDVVGVIVGDIDGLDSDNGDIIPDCWFVYDYESHGYKELNEEFRCDFGDAIRLLKLGYKVCREGWNGKDMWLVLVPGADCKKCVEGSVYDKAGLKSVHIDSHIDMYTAKGTMQPGWVASQADMLAEDWMIVK
jgi:hypothetical protein